VDTKYFFSFFKGLLFGKNILKIYDEDNKFVEKKETLEQMENHSVIKILCPNENPYFLPYNVSVKFFIM
jgi:hypothetical protein